MATTWSVLFALGQVVPALLTLVSAALVVRWARRLRRRRPDTRPPWQWLMGHLVLVGFVGGGLGYRFLLSGLHGLLLSAPVTLLAIAVVPAYLRWTLRRMPDPEARTTGEGRRAASARARSPSRPARRWGLAGLFAATGILLPWLVGIGVKLYLDHQGRPTLPVSDFLALEVVPILLVQTLVLWAFPFLILASALVVPWSVASAADPSGRPSTLPVWLAYALGFLADVVLFTGIFWEFDAIMLIVPLGLSLVPPMAVGYFLGWWIVRHRHRGAPA